MSAISCALGIVFVLAIAALHISGFGEFTSQMNASNASDFLKDMFPILYIMPSLYLCALAIFGMLALAMPAMRKPICLILSVAVFSCGALALLLNEWIPVVVMGAGALLFLAAAFTTTAGQSEPR
ncbi:hypothetical protein [Alterisphingorhabdus coralli]|uniref:Uncharacterized protein n=1 Tax=Alterisphingorhabdus coralli TaxID=3071408 RepID=A0AA97FCA8_9SPHN|nr:hypothetical protein [Parasphingorhabdus sp. SCSIO 66989]WOE76435.1 hypothetical protein RB602_06900 [Parasphingorhabdus sp. SCSIO 66989]